MSVAIADAMNVFWDQGYSGASLPQLLDGMGLTRGSLYKAFDGKKPLFLAALHAYEAQEITPIVNTLRDAALPASARLADVFDRVPDSVRAGDPRGCMLCNAAVSRAVDDPEIAAQVHEMLNKIRDAFAFAVGDVDTAEMLRTQYVGLRNLSRAGLPATALAASVDAVLRSVSD